MRVGITGHRGLGPHVARRVRPLLTERIARCAPAELAGVSCVADGPDSGFAEAVLAHGGRLEVVVPAAEYREGMPAWHRPVYDALLARAGRVHHTGLRESGPEAHQAGSKILVDLVDELVAVGDGEPARGIGGTADAVAYAEWTGVPLRVLRPEGATR